MDSMYDRELVKPMWQELDAVGVRSLNSGAEVDEAMKAAGTTLVMVNSVCGCAAGNARPGVALALQNSKIPNQSYTVFAGVDREATDKARGYMSEVPPSSPSVALFKDGKLIYMLERKHIEGNDPQTIAKHLAAAFDQVCDAKGPSVSEEVFKKTFTGADPACGSTFRVM